MNARRITALIIVATVLLFACRKPKVVEKAYLKSFTKNIAGERRWDVYEHYKCWYCNPQIDNISTSTKKFELFVLDDSTLLDDSGPEALYLKMTDSSQSGLLVYKNVNFGMPVLKYYYLNDSLVYEWSTIGPGEFRVTTYTSKK